MTFQSILVPLDGSPRAEQALPLALSIAEPARSKLRLVLVHRPPPAPLGRAAARLYTSIELSLRKAEREYLKAWVNRVRSRTTCPVTSATLTGPIAPSLEQYVRELGPELVVMATHGRSPLQRAWLGSVADHLVRSLDVPVLLVRPRDGGAAELQPVQGGDILVPLDGSPLAEGALEPSKALARAWDAEIALIQVIEPLTLATDPPMIASTVYDERLTTIRRDAANDYLEGVAERLRADGIRPSSAAVLGMGPVEALLDLARPERYGAVAIATHGRGGLRRMVLGSVADKLVRGADIPVLVCRPKKVRSKR
jgi:nucleotide-binding universal stress UspA family protein